MKKEKAVIMVGGLFFLVSFFIWGMKRIKSIEQSGRTDQGLQETEQNISSMQYHFSHLSDTEEERKIFLYAVKNEEIQDCDEIMLETEETDSESQEYLKQLLKALGSYLGYDLKLNQIIIEREEIVIDFFEDISVAILKGRKKDAAAKIDFEDDSDAYFGVLDSIVTTIRKNENTEHSIWFSVNGENLKWAAGDKLIEVSANNAYMGSKYYLQKEGEQTEKELSLKNGVHNRYEGTIGTEKVKIDIVPNKREEIAEIKITWENKNSSDIYMAIIEESKKLIYEGTEQEFYLLQLQEGTLTGTFHSNETGDAEMIITFISTEDTAG